MLKLLVCLLTAGRLSAELVLEPAEIDWLESHPVITTVSQSNYAPFEFRDTDGNLKGMALDLLDWIALEAGLQVVSLDTTFFEAQSMVLDGRADVLTSLFKSSGRSSKFSFSETAFVVPAHVFTKPGSFSMSSLNALSGKRIAIQRGDYGLEFLGDHDIQYQWIACNSFADAAERVIHGDADLMIGDWQITVWHLEQTHQQTRLAALDEVLYAGDCAFALRPDHAILKNILDRGIIEARDTGMLDKIKHKWLGLHMPENSPYLPYLREILWSTGLLAAGLLLFLIWNLLLRRQVALRTNELQESKEHYRGLFEQPATPQLLIGLDTGKIVEANLSASRYLGVSQARLVGASIRNFLLDDDEQTISFKSVLEEDKPVTLDLKLKHAHGELLDARINAVRVTSSGKSYIFAQVHDISLQVAERRERVRIEEQMLKSQKLESLGVMAGGIAHDFNNLLVGVLGNADLLQRDPSLPVALKPMTDDIRAASLKAAELCKQMLVYAGQTELSKRSFAMNELVLDMESLFHSAVGSKALLQMDTAHEKLLVNGDPSRMRQVMLNLLTNAAEALPGGEGTISIKSGRGRWLEPPENCWSYLPAETEETIWVEVSDDGEGIHQKDLERIFDPFFSTRFTGRGLGLSAVMGIIRAHRGAIHIVSRRGSGTRMTIHLAPAELTGGLTKPSLGLRRMVLIVDENLAHLRSVQQEVSSLGHQVLAVSSGAKARELLDEGLEPDVALISGQLPDLPAAELASELKQLLPEVMLILLGAASNEEHEAFWQECLRLPEESDHLSEVLENLQA
jgi:PAS domain S-box-containing protein